MIPSVSQYAGQQLLTGQQAEAYADHFIAVHITDMAGGQTYSQLSAKAQAQPSNTQLAGLVNTVFKGETLRSMLLNAYGWWKVSQITYIISLAAFGLGAVAGLGSIFLFVTGRRNKSDAPMPRPDTRPSPRSPPHDGKPTRSQRQKPRRIRPTRLTAPAGCA